jgi:hypothetical protein
VIQFETAARIACAYREIEVAETLLEKVTEAIEKGDGRDIRDVFGRPHRALQLGIPSGDNGHRLLDVSYELAVPVIEAHIAQKRAQIEALSNLALAQGMSAGTVETAKQAQGDSPPARSPSGDAPQ